MYTSSLYEINTVSPSLTHLTIINENDPSLTMFEILARCFKKLIELQYISKVDASIPYIEEAELGILHQIISPEEFSLKSLILSVPTFTAPYIQYITNYLPKTLHTLILSIGNMDFYNWIDTHGMDKILKMTDRMSQLKCARLCKEANKAAGSESEKMLSFTTSKNINQLYKTISSLRGGRRFYCTTQYTEKGQLQGVDIFIQGNSTINVRYGLQRQQANNNNLESIFPVPNNGKSMDRLEMINPLQITLLQQQQECTEIEKNYLTPNFKHCNKLQNLKLNAKILV